MKAMIMAGGEGSRLRPLTCDCPKPMVPILDRPVMEYSLDLLKTHGIHEIGVTLMYLPERVMNHFGDGREHGVNLAYYVEETPLGTAGSVKQAAAQMTETFAVLSGDGLTDADLTAAFNFHRERGSMATLILKRVELPLEYGVVITDGGGRIRRFLEKPGWGEVFSDMINTGIYILEPDVLDLIPENKPYDFSRDLFAAMLKADMPLYGWQTEDYWCDIGDISAYIKAHVDLMDGRMKLTTPLKAGGALRAPGARVDRSAVIEGPCYIGRGARVGEGSRIGPYAVLGAGSRVDMGASVKRSVIWPGGRVGPRAQARGCVILSGAELLKSASAFEESAIGNGAIVGEHSTLMPGVRIWPHKRIEDGERVDSNVVWGSRHSHQFSGGLLPFRTPAQAVNDAQAYAGAMSLREVLMARENTPAAFAFSRAASSGFMAQGAQVIDIGVASLPQLRSAMWSMGISGAVYLVEEGMLPLIGRGALLRGDEKRKVIGALERQDYPDAFSQRALSPIQLGRSDYIYFGLLKKHLRQDVLAGRVKIAVYSGKETLLSIAERAMLRLGADVRAEWEEEMMALGQGEIGLWLSKYGEWPTIADEHGALDEGQMQLLIAWTALRCGVERLIVPVGWTDKIEWLAGERVTRVKSDRAEWMHELLKEEDSIQFMLHFDGLFAALKAMECLIAEGLTLREWIGIMPPVFLRTRIVPVDRRDKGHLLRILSQRAADGGILDGVRFTDERGWAWINPLNDRGECQIVGEGADAEFAKELCDYYAGEVEKIVKNGKSQGV